MAGNAPGPDQSPAHPVGVPRKKDEHPNADARCIATTAKGKPCKSRPLPGLDLCGVHAKSAKAKSDAAAAAAAGQVAPAHRPDTITEDRIVFMETLLEAGNYITVACEVVGIGYSTHKDWMSKGESDDPAFAHYRLYRQRIEVALAVGEDNLLKCVMAGAAMGEWRAAAFILERRFPERWAKRKAEGGGDEKDKPPENSLAAILAKAGGQPIGQG